MTHMPAILDDAVASAAVIAPALLFLTAAIWSIADKFGVIRRNGPFHPYDMRTWRLPYALGYTALFALVFSTVLTALGGTSDAAELSLMLGVVVAIHLMPYVATLRRHGRT